MAKFDSAASLDAAAEDILEEDVIPLEEKPLSPERRLWLAVIARCWDDAFCASDFFLRQSESKHVDVDLVRGEARRWLTIDIDPWRKHRQTVCDLAEIDSLMLRNAAKQKLKLVKEQEAEQHTAQVQKIDQMFAALLSDAESMAPEDIDTALEGLVALEAV